MPLRSESSLFHITYMAGVDEEHPQNVYDLLKLMTKLDCLCVAVGR